MSNQSESDVGGGGERHLAGFSPGWPPAQPGEEVFAGVRPRDLGALPASQPLTVDQEGEQTQHQTVSHVEDADDLERLNLTYNLKYIHLSPQRW